MDVMKKHSISHIGNTDTYRKMVEEVEDYAILLMDIDGTILNWNKGAQKIKGYTEEEILGKNFRIFYRAEDQETNLPGHLIELAAREGKALHEGWRIRKDGTTFWGSILITALHDNDGHIIGFSKVTRDLTEKRAIEERERQYAMELEKRNKELEQFAYIAGHDLQEPLRKISTLGDFLAGKYADKLDEGGVDLVARIRSASQRMKKLIDDLLVYSEVSKQPDTDKELFEVPADIQETLEYFEEQVTARGASINIESPFTIYGNKSQLTQAFQNLISNSLKYAREGVAPVINISARRVAGSDTGFNLRPDDYEKSFLLVEFTDNGIGFQQEYAGKIFQVFQRLHGRAEFSGSGIGLSIVQKVVENHGGYIQATGHPGAGAVFHILFPVD